MVAESLRPGSNVSALARRFGVNRGLLQAWRRTAVQEASDRDGLFVPLRLENASATADTEMPVSKSAASAGSDPASKPGAIEIESAGLRVRFSGPIDPGALRLVLAHIGRRT